MTPQDELVQALVPVVCCFRSLNVRYYVGGSVASSFHGAMRSTMDVDIVAELESNHVPQFLANLGDDYYASEAAIREAISRRSSFNLIHLATSFKVDVFINKRRPFDLSAFERVRMSDLGLPGEELEVAIASIEDVVIAKLLWFREGNEVSERQWDDVTRLCKLHHDSLDRPYLQSYCRDLGVDDLLRRLLDQL